MREPIQLFGVYIHEDKREKRLDFNGGLMESAAEEYAKYWRRLSPDADIYIKVVSTIFADELMR